MTRQDPHRSGAFDDALPVRPAGGAPVADLRTLEPDRGLAVLLLRDWFDGAEGRERVTAVLTDALGPHAGAPAVEAWGELCGILAAQARRPVMRHSTSCSCVGADEAVVSLAVQLAARGEREDAMMVLALLIPGDRLLCALSAAERTGLALRRAALRLQAVPPAETPPRGRLH